MALTESTHADLEAIGRKPDTLWASALRAAAAVARRAAASQDDVLQAITHELPNLGLHGAVWLTTPDGLLEIRTWSIGRAVDDGLKRLTGIDIGAYRVDPEQVDLYREALSRREAMFTADRRVVISQMIPASVRPLVDAIMGLLGEHPVIVAPLLADNRVLGALNVSGDWLTEGDIPMVMALADHVSIALDHVQARAEMRASLDRQRLRNQVVEAVASALDLPLVLERVIRLALEVTGAEAGAIGLIEADGDTMTYPHLFGLPPTLRPSPAPRGKGLAWRIATDGKPILLNDYADDPEALPEWVQAGVHAFLGVPLIVSGETIGALGLFSLHQNRTFHDEQVDMMQAVAQMAAIAVKNARLYAEVNQRASESQALMWTARSISASLDLETVLNLIAEQAMELTKADGSRIHLYDPDLDVLRCLVARDPRGEEMLSVELKPGEGFVGFVMQSGVPMLSNDPASDPRGVHIPGTMVDEPECLILAPLSIRQRTMGVMTVRRIGQERLFYPSDLELLSAFAAQAAVAIENAHLYGQIEAQAQRLEAEVVKRTRDLARSEARYRALVETSLAGIFQLDADGKLDYANQAFIKLLERQPQDLVGRPALDLLGLSHLRQRQTDNRQEESLREVYSLELESGTGRRIPSMVAVSMITDENGTPQGVTGLVLDISERTQLEADLRAERDRLDAILTSVGDAVLVTDAEGTIEYVNPAWERLTGYQAEEALGKTPRISKSGEQDVAVYADLWRTILAGKTWQGEIINRRKDGSYYDAALTVTPIVGPTGNVINLVGVLYDISALKELDRLKTQFVSDVSHELRTPLTNILLYLDLLASTEDRDKTARYLATLSRESDRLAHLIDDLLSLSRLESGSTPFEPAPVDINHLLGSLAYDRRNLAASQGLEIELDCLDQAPPAMGDERLLAQVFTNLLTNAMNYTQEGGRITLSTRLERQDGEGWLVAAVEDTGLGIPIEEQPMIFRRFFRGLASETTSAPGTGLGLAICKKIAERHGGRITVESVGIPGRGTRFTLWLPLANESRRVETRDEG
ncbi:MAG TPA: GAF domain-containing protein [Anaerolineales bacterium]|nr:GAF domain-containing protein [Anaerolineales bacterium]